MYCRQVKTRQGNALFGVLNSPMYIDWGSVGVGGGGGGSTHRSFIQGGSPEVQPLTLLYTIFDRKVAVSYTFY